MKIGVLTLHFHTNYGGIMQAYALQKVLEQLGHDSYVINIYNWSGKPHNRFWYFMAKTYYSFYKIVHLNNVLRQRKIRIFIRKHIKQIKYNSFNYIKESDFDAIIVGSDQIWRNLFIPKIESVFLDFTHDWNIKRLSYAASFGTDIWTYTKEQTEACSELIKHFNLVTVRESSAVKLCNDYLNCSAIQVLDPTLLFTKNDYLKLLNIKEQSCDGLMLTYILNETDNLKQMSMAISSDKELNNVSIYPENNTTGNLPSVTEWLQLIANADFVFTDSFHVSVFSIIFNKPFVVVQNSLSGNTRLESLLNILHLNGNMISEDCNVKEAIIQCRDIRPASLHSYNILKKEVKRSLTILEKALN